MCCRQILLVSAVHGGDAAVLHLLWSGVCGRDAQPAGSRGGFQQPLPHHEPLLRLCHPCAGQSLPLLLSPPPPLLLPPLVIAAADLPETIYDHLR